MCKMDRRTWDQYQMKDSQHFCYPWIQMGGWGPRKKKKVILLIASELTYIISLASKVAAHYCYFYLQTG